jgi:hypothetical protein
MATQGPQKKPIRARRYYCANPLNDACRKGFTSLSGYSRHKNRVHSGPKHLTRPRQSALIPELDINLPAAQEGLHGILEGHIPELEGGWYLNHPVLDGKL